MRNNYIQEDIMNATHEEIMKSFNRNALGRLVSNSETVQGLPVTTKESIEHLSMDNQISLLNARLEEIGGSKYRATEFEFDDGPSWPGFTTGQTWNGWACPFFTKEIAMHILDWMAEGNTEGEGTIYEETENTLTIIDLQYPEEPYTIEATEEGLYNLGGSWTWSEKTYYCSLCGQTYEKGDVGVVDDFCSQYCKEEAEFNVAEQDNYNKECEMSEFRTEGFKYIKDSGIIEFVNLLQQQGTIDLLWDMQPKTKINALMQSENFDMDAHIKTNYRDQDYDEVCTDMLDEMLETIITLEYCFIYDVYNIDFKGRSLHNLDKIPEAKVWSPNIYLPITAGPLFDSFDDFAGYCIEHLGHDMEELTVRIDAKAEEDSSDGQVTQSFEYKVTGAGDCNCLGDIVESLLGWDYIITYTVIR
jgi:hypothetical protein